MRSLRDYSVISASYWVFTLTDGALRMLVLLFLHQSGRTPLEIASLFLFYEFFGVITNLFGGWLGARFGLKLTLFSGLLLQTLACAMLALNAAHLTLPILMLAQAMAGTAKDLTKMSSKSYVKLVVPEGDAHALMRWVAILTGSKNTLKGIGFFLGGLLLSSLGFGAACRSMAIALAITLLAALLLLPRAAGKAPDSFGLSSIISRDPKVNWLSAARFFLFGSRDIWFVLALPIFLSTTLSLDHAQVGGCLALWVIGYGLVQAVAPAIVGGKRDDPARPVPGARRLGSWTLALLLPLGAIIVGLSLEAPAAETLIAGLVAFGFVFAINSAIHSFLIVSYSDGDRISLNVGFYYMANAAGRLTGTVLSGTLFQFAGQGQAGLLLCLAASMVFVLLSALLCCILKKHECRAGLASGQA